MYYGHWAQELFDFQFLNYIETIGSLNNNDNPICIVSKDRI